MIKEDESFELETTRDMGYLKHDHIPFLIAMGRSDSGLRLEEIEELPDSFSDLGSDSWHGQTVVTSVL